ncbi:MAG: DNA alkylation repair protein [Candidatus Levyibacteriota bacterium]
MNYLLNLKRDLKKLENKKKAAFLQRFFKTGKGEYGEDDVFIGLTVPQCRKIAAKYKDLEFLDVKKLLYSKIHEERMISLFILISQFEKGDEKKKIFDFYIANSKRVNNWDLVDSSAHKIAGVYLLNKPKDVLYKFANSSNLWQKRISLISTFHFIKFEKFDDSLKLAEVLIFDKHDLIQKALGWMLREIGKKDKSVEVKFLNKYYKKMGRTALRYAIERFLEGERLKYLHGKI